MKISPIGGSNAVKKKQTLVLIAASALLLGVVFIGAYFADKGKSKQDGSSSQKVVSDAVKLSVPGAQLNDKDVWRANEGTRILALQKKLEALEIELDKKEKESEASINQKVNESVNARNSREFNPTIKMDDVPMPPRPMGSNGGGFVSAEDFDNKPVKPIKNLSPKVGNNTKARVNSVGGDLQTEQAGVVEQQEIVKQSFNLEVRKAESKKDVSEASISNSAESGSFANRNKENYIPAGTIIPVAMLAGLDAPTGGQAQSNPHPALFSVVDPAKLPNRVKANLVECALTGNGYGDISSERAYIRSDRLSCIDSDGGAIDVEIKGYIAGEDGKAGMRGRLVSKQGQALANAFLAGIGTGIGQAFRDSATTTNQSAFGSTQTVNGGQELQAGLASGVGNAMSMLAKYYIKLAEQVFPVIEVDSGRVVDLVLTRGVTIERQ